MTRNVDVTKSRAHARAEIDVFAPKTTGGSERITCVFLEIDGKTQEGKGVNRTPVTKI